MPACTTPLLCPVWWAATRVSLSSTVTGSPGASINNCRATANPTIPAPTTTTLIRHHRVPTRRGLSHSCDAPPLLFALALHRPHRQGSPTSLGTGRPCRLRSFPAGNTPKHDGSTGCLRCPSSRRRSPILSTTVGAAAVDGRAIVADHTMADERNGAVPSSGASAEQGARTRPTTSSCAARTVSAPGSPVSYTHLRAH